MLRVCSQRTDVIYKQQFYLNLMTKIVCKINKKLSGAKYFSWWIKNHEKYDECSHLSSCSLKERERTRVWMRNTRREGAGALEASRPDNLKAIRSSRGSCLPYA